MTGKPQGRTAAGGGAPQGWWLALAPNQTRGLCHHAFEILVSADQGRTWTALPLPWAADDLCAVAIDPGRPDRV